MIAHGLVSSALFCIAKLFYERTGTRKLSVRRGIKKLITLMPYFWLIFAAAKLGLPPLPKAMGEILIFSGVINWKIINFIPTILGIILTGVFSLYIYQQLKSGAHFLWKKKRITLKEREYTTLTLHLIPLLLLITNPKVMTLYLVSLSKTLVCETKKGKLYPLGRGQEITFGPLSLSVCS
jgi:NADH-ubiquinone oxidoreductase chain 4